jgi:hypothetical protein
MIVAGLAAVLFLTVRPAPAQEKGRAQEREGAPDRERAMERERPAGRDLEMQRKQLELNQVRANFDYQNEMREIELAQKRLELERQSQAIKAPGQQPQYMSGKKWQGHHKMKHCMGFMFFCFIVNLLLAIWVYQDIRKRNAGSGVWIVITFMIGFFGALLYVISRIGDNRSA